MKIEDRFTAKVRRQDDRCWIWTGAIVKAVGYGRFGMPGNQTDYAHRAAWRIFRGEIPAGAYVCHRCDVRSCTNPDHLFLGTHRDNMRDAANKGRVRIPRASYASDETHQPAKLTNDQVRVIRAADRRYGVATQLARQFAVSVSAVCLARDGHTFKDVR